MKDVIRYSEAFKLAVLRSLETGKHPSCRSAEQAYGIKGPGTVRYWARKFGKEHLCGRVVRVETADERSELKRLRQEVRKLKDALADAHIELKLERAYTEIACEAAGIEDVPSFKKKADSEPFTRRATPAVERSESSARCAGKST